MNRVGRGIDEVQDQWRNNSLAQPGAETLALVKCKPPDSTAKSSLPALVCTIHVSYTAFFEMLSATVNDDFGSVESFQPTITFTLNRVLSYGQGYVRGKSS